MGCKLILFHDDQQTNIFLVKPKPLLDSIFSGGKESEMSLALHFHRYKPPTLKSGQNYPGFNQVSLTGLLVG